MFAAVTLWQSCGQFPGVIEGGIKHPGTDDGGTGSAGGTAEAGGSAVSGGGAASGGGSASGGGAAALCDVPVEVNAVLVSRCQQCHGAPPSSGAPQSLITRANLLAPSSAGGVDMGHQSVARMQATSAPMPPTYAGTATAQEIATFVNWVNAGMIEGSCGDAGVTVVDAGPKPTTCASNNFWPDPGDGNTNMNPGMACQACHSRQNFMGQNPGSALGASQENRSFMGTVFQGLNEMNACSANDPAGATVEIFNDAGIILVSSGGATNAMRVYGSGNFYGNMPGGRNAAIPPYRARVKYAGRTIEMQTFQLNGDCNTCHTEQGTSGAPGRIILP